MEDYRTPFEDAVRSFRKFAGDNGMATDFFWISQDRVCVVGCRVWIFRPDEILGDEHAKRFYESIRLGDSSLKLLGIAPLGTRHIACVEEMPAPPHLPKQLYMSLNGNPRYRILSVTSRVLWIFLRWMPSLSKRDEIITDLISLDHTMKSI